MPGMCRFSCVCASPVIIIKNYFELDAAAYIIGISVKSWVKECLVSVDGGCRGSIMLWFAFGFVIAGAHFFKICLVFVRDYLPQISQQLNGAPAPNVEDAFQTI